METRLNIIYQYTRYISSRIYIYISVYYCNVIYYNCYKIFIPIRILWVSRRFKTGIHVHCTIVHASVNNLNFNPINPINPVNIIAHIAVFKSIVLVDLKRYDDGQMVTETAKEILKTIDNNVLQLTDTIEKETLSALPILSDRKMSFDSDLELEDRVVLEFLYPRLK